MPETKPTLHAAQSTQTAVQDTGWGCLTRMGWMLIGNGLLLALAVSIMKHKTGFLSLFDLAFWATAGAAILVRHIDVTRMGGRTATGQPTTLVHWRRYVAILMGVCVLLWSAAHSIAWYGR